MKQDYRNRYDECMVRVTPLEFKSGRQVRNERRKKQTKIKTPRY
jgi:hypothetical protein